MKQEMMGWQWNYLDHMKVICSFFAPRSKQHVITTGWMLFLMPNQQCQSTESNCFFTLIP